MNLASLESLLSRVRALRRLSRGTPVPLPELSGSAVRVLGVVARTSVETPASPSRVASALDMASSNVAGALRELDAAGLIIRDRADGDARRVVVSLTRHGAALLDEHRSLRVDVVHQAIEQALSEQEQQQLLAVVPLLDRVIHAASLR